jgi:serine/threonine protein kinase
MTSPPTTPPSDLQPFNLGDLIDNGRYSLTRKLADGPYSTVWLAIREWSSSFEMTQRYALNELPIAPPYVAVKIMDADLSKTSTELAMLMHLSSVAGKEPDPRHITRFLEHFELQSPNGTHQCLVFQLMSTTAASLVEDLPAEELTVVPGETLPDDLLPDDFLPEEELTTGMEEPTIEELPDNQQEISKPQRYPVWMAKKILLHTLRGLALLHKNGIAHSNIQPDNLLIAIETALDFALPQLGQDEAAAARPSHRIDGNHALWNVYLRQHQRQYKQLDQEFLIKLGGFGAGKLPKIQPAVA